MRRRQLLTPGRPTKEQNVRLIRNRGPQWPDPARSFGFRTHGPDDDPGEILNAADKARDETKRADADTRQRRAGA